MEWIFSLIGIALFVAWIVGSVLGWIAWLQLRQLKREWQTYQWKQSFQEQKNELGPAQSSAGAYEEQLAQWASQDAKDKHDQPTPSSTWAEAVAEPAPKPLEPNLESVVEPEVEGVEYPVSRSRQFLQHIQQHWMVWIGGISVALAAIFLVRYSIEQGYLSPSIRIAAAIIGALSLHGLAEFLRRRTPEYSSALAALAGAASIGLFAAILAAQHLYTMWSAGFSFVVLVMVALATMALALVHGPILAIFGIVGAYLVPTMVGGDSGQYQWVLLYASVITASALLLQRWIQRTWIAWLALGGVIFWFLNGLDLELVDRPLLPWFLTLAAYMFYSIDQGNWGLRQHQKLTRAVTEHEGWRRIRDLVFHSDAKLRALFSMQILLIIAWALLIVRDNEQVASLIMLMPMVVLQLIAARHNESLRLLPWLTFLLFVVANLLWLSAYGDLLQLQIELLPTHSSAWASWWVVSTLLFMLVSLFNGDVLQAQRPQQSFHLTLGLLAPVISLWLAQRVWDPLPQSIFWALSCFLLATIYWLGAELSRQRQRFSREALWLLVAAHAALILSLIMELEQSSLSLGLSVMTISLTWLRRRFVMPALQVLIKALLLVLVLRLSLNPWLLTYANDSHWSFWTYGLSTVAVVVAAWLSRDHAKLHIWLTATAMHLGLLFIALEWRYWLYDGEIFRNEYGFVEACINTPIWLATAWLYHWRSGLSRTLQRLYQVACRLMLLLAGLNYLLLIVVLNPLVQVDEYGQWPLFNLLLVAYALPLIGFWFVPKILGEASRLPIRLAIAASAFLLLNMEVRELWQQELNLYHSVGDGELYSYSLLWLTLAIAAMARSYIKHSVWVYRLGMALLITTIAKIMLIDTSDLQGLWRVFSLLGLGLSLLGLAYWHQQLSRRQQLQTQTE